MLYLVWRLGRRERSELPTLFIERSEINSFSLTFHQLSIFDLLREKLKPLSISHAPKILFIINDELWFGM